MSNIERLEREIAELKRHGNIFWRTVRAKEKILEELKSNK